MVENMWGAVMEDCDWIGAKEERFRWKTFRFEWGRWHYKVDCMGREIAAWWEWEQ